MSEIIIWRLKRLACWGLCLWSVLCFSDDHLEMYLKATNPIIGGQRLETNIIENLKEMSCEQKDNISKIREEYLISIVDTSESNMVMKRTAIVLLGKMKTTKATKCLIKHIDYKDDAHRDLPALGALVDGGEESIPFLVEGIDSENNRMRTSLMVRAIMAIKKDQYHVFVEDAKKRYSKKVQDALMKFAFY